ncbi:molybdopterin molybdotransferase MoeA [Sulfuritalea hydrogenivorans]|uniref:Molybdopterin molybdenumtransferase n=1 Tax=Sulfuritalea hydrogenivorans sk43H TaxID=1223802 RepID=W0SG63_9PROT|nr:gephyrin-like molybdotransferase Glp [Sulfuritalea hydrogenivorans]BAO30269.1 molybdenum cofactor synthesis protein [Sulfuritalea hydrogenivorans sk43H]
MSRNMLYFEEALARLLAGADPLRETETVPTQSAAGRILAQGLRSAIDVPPLDNTSMDGYAVRCADVPTAGTRLAVAQRIPAGSVGHVLAAGTAARIFTGAPLPAGADAVVMQELCALEDGSVTVNHVPHPGEWIRRRGEDIAAGAEVLAAGTRLSAAHVGVAASVGAARLAVFRRLRVALFSTGDELAMPGEPLKPGGIYNSNRYTLRALLEGLGCEVADLGIVPDNREATRAALREAAAANDLILTSGGVSVGEEDHVKPAVEAEGALDLWKIAIKPGKPLAFGRVGAAAFIGLPGNPVSSFVTFIMLVRPFILKAQGAASVMPRAQSLRADCEWKGDPRREFLRARINAQGGLELFANQSSGVLTSCTWADGLIDNPPGQAIRRGDTLRFLPFSELLY